MKRIHFEDFDGHEFERLVLAYAWRSGRWQSLEWYGEVGKDRGRDIRGVSNAAPPHDVLIQCANRERLTAKKAISDLGAAIQCEGVAPHTFVVVAGRSVTPTTRDEIMRHASELGVAVCEVWSGADFEERIRQLGSAGESLLRRFCDGDSFPDDPTALRDFPSCEPGRGSVPSPGDARFVLRVRVMLGEMVAFGAGMTPARVPMFQVSISNVGAATTYVSSVALHAMVSGERRQFHLVQIRPAIVSAQTNPPLGSPLEPGRSQTQHYPLRDLREQLRSGGQEVVPLEVVVRDEIDNCFRAPIPENVRASLMSGSDSA